MFGFETVKSVLLSNIMQAPKSSDPETFSTKTVYQFEAQILPVTNINRIIDRLQLSIAKWTLRCI